MFRFDGISFTDKEVFGDRSPQARLATAKEYSRRGYDYLRQRDFEKAENSYSMSIFTLENVLREHGEITEIMRELSRSYSMRCTLCRLVTDEKKRSEAEGWAKKALEIDEKIAKKEGTPQAYDDLACSYDTMGGVACDVSYCEKALAIWRDLHKKYPKESLYVKRIEDEEFNIRKLKEYISRKK